MMLGCWKEKKEQRPSFTQMRLKLKALAISLNRASKVVTNSDFPDDEYIEMEQC